MTTPDELLQRIRELENAVMEIYTSLDYEDQPYWSDYDFMKFVMPTRWKEKYGIEREKKS